MSVLPPPFAPLSPLHCVDEDDHDSSDADIDIDGQELVNEPKGIHEPFEDMDCFQVSFPCSHYLSLSFSLTLGLYLC